MHFDQKVDQKFEHYSCMMRTIDTASWPFLLKFRENLPNSQKFRGPTPSGRSQDGQR